VRDGLEGDMFECMNIMPFGSCVGPGGACSICQYPRGMACAVSVCVLKAIQLAQKHGLLMNHQSNRRFSHQIVRFDKGVVAFLRTLIHITDAVGTSIQKKGLRKVGLLGTRPTMEENFYKKRLKDNFEIEAIVPDEESRIFIQQVIYKELAKGIFTEDSKRRYLDICDVIRVYDLHDIWNN